MRLTVGLLFTTGRRLPFVRAAFLPFRTQYRHYAASVRSFESAKAALNTLKQEPDNEVKLRIYALYKQATLGDCADPKPGMLNFVAAAKWQAWNSLKSMTKDEAESQYVRLITDLIRKEEGVSNKTANFSLSSEQNSGLDCSLERGILKLTLNRPRKKNAITPEMYRVWTQQLEDASNNPDVKLIVVTGNGDYFSSGNDLTTFVKPLQSGVSIHEMALQGRAILQRFVAAFIDCSKPLVALINGPAVGISVTTLGLYDLVIATDCATFHTPFVNLGQTPEGCSSYTFPRIMGPLRASDMLLFNHKITAQEAQACGLVNRIFSADQFSAKCTELLNNELSNLPSESLRYAKEIVRARDRPVLHQVNVTECQRLAERWTSQECMTAISQFFQRPK